MKTSIVQTFSYLIAAALLLACLHLKLVAALFAGLLVFTLINQISPLLARLCSGRNAQIAASLIVAIGVVTAVSLGAFGLLLHLKNGDTAGLPQLWAKLADIVDSANAILPAAIRDYLPGSADELKNVVVSWLHEHSGEIQRIGKEMGITFVHILLGGIIGAMIAVSNTLSRADRKPLAAALHSRAANFHDAFRRVVIGQGKISLINTFFTGIYLLIALPMADIHLPFVKTMLAVTLLVGILPIIGNLISNTVIILVSASLSFNAAIASLVFLIVLHKAEYFLSAKILGHQINAKAWEMMLAMLLMEAAFGIPGLAMAPMLYAYIKSELVQAELI